MIFENLAKYMKQLIFLGIVWQPCFEKPSDFKQNKISYNYFIQILSITSIRKKVFKKILTTLPFLKKNNRNKKIRLLRLFQRHISHMNRIETKNTKNQNTIKH